MSVDALFAKLTRKDAREARAIRKHEYRMALIADMSGDEKGTLVCVHAIIRWVAVVLVAVVLTIGSTSTIENIHSDRYDHKTKLACMQALAAAHVQGNCVDGTTKIK